MILELQKTLPGTTKQRKLILESRKTQPGTTKTKKSDIGIKENTARNNENNEK